MCPLILPREPKRPRGGIESRAPDIAKKMTIMAHFGPKKSDKVPGPKKAGKRLKHREHREHREHRGCTGTFIDVAVRQMDQGFGRVRQDIWILSLKLLRVSRRSFG